MADPLPPAPAPQATEAFAESRSPAALAARRSVWLKTLHQWHWISSALRLLGMLFFSFTGITLNHATQIEAKPRIPHREASLQLPLQAALRAPASAQEGRTP